MEQNNLCLEKHKTIDDRLHAHDNKLEEHDKKIDKLSEDDREYKMQIQIYVKT